MLGEDVELPADVEIGGHVVIHARSRIGPGALIQDAAVIGKPPVLAERSSAATTDPGTATIIGEGARVLAGAILLAGVEMGTGAIAGDQCQIRERSSVGAESVIGRGVAIDNDVRIGERVVVQTNSYVTGHTEIEDDVFVGPGVTMTNDHTMARLPSDASLEGPRLRRACRIGGAVVVCPGVEIGEEAFVAAGAVVTGDVPSRAVMIGVPARHIRDVPDEDLLERWL